MSAHRSQSTAMGKIVDYLRFISTEMGGGENTNTPGGEENKKRYHRQKYIRVPSKPALSVSTTSTSLATTCGSQATLATNAYSPVQRREEPSAEAEFSDDDERSPLGLSKEPPITIKERNLQNFARPVMETTKCQDGPINGDPSPYKPTTQKIFIYTQLFAAVAVSIVSMILGFASGYSSPATAQMLSENSTLPITQNQASWFGGLMPLSALVGGIVAGILVDGIGRRNTVMLVTLPFFASWMVIANSTTVWMLFLGRAICGFSVGIASLAYPLYLGETLQPEIRGSLGILPAAFGNIGILLCFIAGKYITWSELAYLGSTLAILCLALTLWIPESPRWHITKGHTTKARSSLEWLRGKQVDVEQEYNELIETEKQSKNDKASAMELVTNKKYTKALLISLGLMFFQQLSGINAVIFYTVRIFQDAGIENMDENDSSIIVATVNFASTFVALFLIDRLGRKLLLCISSVSMIVTLAILGGFFYYKNALLFDVSHIGWLPLMCLVLYVIGFSLGFGPMPWFMMGEILPKKVRGPAGAIATAFNWACTFLVTKTFSDMIILVGIHGAFWIFCAFCVMSLFFVIFFVPETQGKTLEEIELNLTGGKGSQVTMNC